MTVTHERKPRQPNRPRAEVVIDHLRSMSPDELDQIGRAMATDSPRAAAILAEALTTPRTRA